MDFGLNRVADVALAIVAVAMAATIVQSSNTAAIVNAVGSTFSGSIRAARG